MPDKKYPDEKKDGAGDGIEINIPETREHLQTPENQGAQQTQDATTEQELRKQLENMDGEAPVTRPAQAALAAKSPVHEEKIAKLLVLAQEKGVSHAVDMAKKMDDPYVLDMLHDALAEKGLYEKFKK